MAQAVMVRQQPAAAGSTREMLITLTVMLGVVMAIIDTTIVNVAITTIGGNLGASTDEVSWVATGYILATVIVMPLNGWLTAYLGRKRFYTASLIIFTVSSLLCGTATNITQLVIYRIIQGIGGGALQPTAQAILFETYPPARRGAAMAIFGLGAMVGPAIGPTLGGYIIDNSTWPLIFYINVPIGIVAILMTQAFIPDPAYIQRPKRGIDWIGLGLLAAGLGSLQYVLERGQRDDWFSSSTIVILSAVSLVTLTIFVIKALRDTEPLVNLRVFRYLSFAVGNVMSIVTGFGLYGVALILPLFLQSTLGFTAFETGMALMPGAAATAVSMLVAGRVINRFDPRVLIAFGFFMFIWATWLLGGLTTEAGYWNIFWPRIVQGLGLGFLFVPLSTVALSAVPIGEMANATGIYSLVRQLGGSLGIAVLTMLLERHTAIALNVLASGVTQTYNMSRIALSQLVEQQAQMVAYDYLFQLCAIVFLVAAPLLLFMRPAKSTAASAAAAEVMMD
jgi:MFS transporter, DHA2 family, multidrug resistance protein